MVRPLWRVEAPPLVILALEERLAPSSDDAAWAIAVNGKGVRMGAERRARERRAVATVDLSDDSLGDACRVSNERSCLGDIGWERVRGRKDEE